MSTSSDNRTIEDILLKPDAIPRDATQNHGERSLGDDDCGSVRIGVHSGSEGCLVGLFTDGDLRRLLLRSQKPLSALFADDIIDHARTEFMSVDRHTSISEALSLLQQREIFDLPVLASDGKLEGVIHLHPALRALLESDGA